MRKLLAVAVLTTCVISAAAALAAGPTPVPVLANPNKSEAGGVSANGYLIWYQSPNRGGGPQSYVFLRQDNHAAVRLSPLTKISYAGGTDGVRAIYQTVPKGASTNSALVLYDIAAKKAVPLPAGVNTPAWEWSPTISGDWILFGRETTPHFQTGRVILRNRMTGAAIQLAQTSQRNGAYLAPGQVNGNWATWYGCVKRCHVHRYNISTGKSELLPNPSPNLNPRNSSIASDGTVFYTESTAGPQPYSCGQQSRLVEQPPGSGAPVVIRTFSSGIDAYSTSVDDTGTATAVLFTRVHCGSQATDVYKLTAP